MDIDIERYALLMDFYSPLLKERQRRIFEAWCLEDMSLSEISENFDISRQAASDMLCRVRRQLEDYERGLGLVDKFGKIRESLGRIKELADGAGSPGGEKIRELADRIDALL